MRVAIVAPCLFVFTTIAVPCSAQIPWRIGQPSSTPFGKIKGGTTLADAQFVPSKQQQAQWAAALDRYLKGEQERYYFEQVLAFQRDIYAETARNRSLVAKGRQEIDRAEKKPTALEDLRAIVIKREAAHSAAKTAAAAQFVKNLDAVKSQARRWLSGADFNDLCKQFDEDVRRFNEDGRAPRTDLAIRPVIAYQRQVYPTREALREAQDRLITVLNGAGLRDEADRLTAKSRDLEREARKIVPFEEGSRWKGERLMLKSDNKAPFQLRVDKIQGHSFEGVAAVNPGMGGAPVMKVEGGFDGLNVNWQTVSMKQSTMRAWRIDGIVLGDTILGAFTGYNLDDKGVPTSVAGFIKIEVQ